MSKKFTISQRALGIDDNDWAVLMAIIKPVISAYVMPDETKAAIADAERQAKVEALRASIQFLRDYNGGESNIPTQTEGGEIISEAMAEIGKEMNKAFGFDGWTMHDPTLGSVALSVDDMATYGVIDFLDMSTWEMVEPFPGGQSFEFMPGQMAKIWNRVSYNNASTNQNYNAKYDGRPSKEFEAQGEQLYAWINVGPKRNVRLMGLDTTL